MPTTPKYVRLAERLNRTLIADVEGGSGWSIAGLDVKEVPDERDEPAAHRFVLDAVRIGKLEKATKDEYDAVRRAERLVAEAGAYDPDYEDHNEAAVQAAAKKANRDLLAGVVDAEKEEDDESDDDDFSDLTRDELVALGNSEPYNLGLAANISKAEALAAVKAAVEEENSGS